MEQQNTAEENGSNKGTMCRQSSARWTPTADQVRILKDLYYNNGLRSPTADQIQRISATLRQYGKIEGKNVFYWFQNHKARERQKKRFGPPITGAPSPQVLPLPHPHRRHHVAPMQRALSCDHYNVNSRIFKNDQDCSFPNRSYGVNIIPSGYYCGSSGSARAASSANGKMTRSFESVSMENRLRDCSISPSSQSLSSLASVDHCCYRKPLDFFGSASGDEKESPENIKTLPLFPINPSEANDVNRRWYRSDQKSDGNGGVSHAASLELSLNSYTGVSPTE